MSGHKRSKFFSYAELRGRGWTGKLISDLLPKPSAVRTARGHTVRLWDKSVVAELERSDAFAAAAEAPKRPHESRLSGFLPELEASWNGAEKDDSSEWLLASLYHRAISERLNSYTSKREPRLTQAKGFAGQFLALERRCDGREIPRILSQFILAAACFSEYPTVYHAEAVKARYPFVLRAAAGAAVAALTAARSAEAVEPFLRLEDFPVNQLLSRTVDSIYSVWFVPRAIRTSLSLLVALNPKDEYPAARAMSRRFIIHLGGTNTGKTYAGFQRLIRAETGVYLAPLRLLALEAQETLLNAGVECSLTTGEEEDRRASDTHVAATAEKLDMTVRYDVAVIDECQMIQDPQRGYAWTRAILGVLAPEVHLCAAPEARSILVRLIESCGDEYEIMEHKRKTPLIPMKNPIDFEKVQPGDALITFSKLGVLSVAEDRRQAGKEPAIIYGALPYSTRRKQMEGFLEGKMQYVVSTDAIGMGLNLPIKRIIFMETEKFDGVERRELKPSEIQQIAGRAGRYGMYEKGYVGATQNIGFIRAGLSAIVPPVEKAVVGFSDLVLSVDFDLLEVLTEWSRMPTVEPYVKLDISRYIKIITKLRELGFSLTREEELRAANIPFDEEDEALLELFHSYLSRYKEGGEILQPELGEDIAHTLPELELHCRKLDLYFSFSKAFGVDIDEERLYSAREDAASEINEILIHRLKNNIRFCARCSKPLPLNYRGRLCDACFRKTRRIKLGY